MPYSFGCTVLRFCVAADSASRAAAVAQATPAECARTPRQRSGEKRPGRHRCSAAAYPHSTVSLASITGAISGSTKGASGVSRCACHVVFPLPFPLGPTPLGGTGGAGRECSRNCELETVGAHSHPIGCERSFLAPFRCFHRLSAVHQPWQVNALLSHLPCLEDPTCRTNPCLQDQVEPILHPRANVPRRHVDRHLAVRPPGHQGVGGEGWAVRPREVRRAVRPVHSSRTHIPGCYPLLALVGRSSLALMAPPRAKWSFSMCPGTGRLFTW